MVEMEVGKCDGMEEGKENAHPTLLEIMYGKPRGYLEVGARHWRK